MQFPASAASSLIEGYCGDFVCLAAVLAQTLEQVSIRSIDIEGSRPALERTERGMRQLAEAIQELLQKLPAQPAAAPPAAAAQPIASLPGPTPAATAIDKRVDRSNGLPNKATSLRVDMRPPALEPPAATAAKLMPRAAEPSQPTARPPAASRTETRVVTAPGNRPRAATGPLPKPAPPLAATPIHPSRSGGRRDGAKPEGIKGNSQSMPLLSVFQFLGRMRKVGTMKVTLPDEEIMFELENGCVSFTSSDHCPHQERLGELLIEADSCSRADVDRVLAKVDAGSTELFGQLALHENIVTKEQVLAALEEQVRRRFTRACRHTDANYEFLQDVRNGIERRFRIQPVAVG